MSITYEVHTDLPPEQLDKLAMDTFVRWVNFALGNESLGGKSLKPISFSYAKSINLKRESPLGYLIESDPSIAPYAGVFDTGYDGFNIGAKMLRGKPSRVIPMPNPENSVKRPHGGTISSISRQGSRSSPKISGKSGGKIYLLPSGKTNFRTITQKNIAQGVWQVPGMRAMRPAYELSKIASRNAHHIG
jgi:hypothetical protein